LRAALEWSLETEKAELGLRIVAALQEFWIAHNHLKEGRAWLEQLLKWSDEVAPAVRAKAFLEAGLLEHIIGSDSPSSQRRFCEESLALFRQLGNTWGIAYSLHVLGMVASYQGDNAAARSLSEESLVLRREIDDKKGIPWTLGTLADVAWSEGDYSLARSLLEEALTVAQSSGCVSAVAYALSRLGVLARDEGDLVSARRLLEQSLSGYRQMGEQHESLFVLYYLGQVAAAQGDYVTVRRSLGKWFATMRKMGHRADIAHGLEELAKVAAAERDMARAVRLWAAAEGLREAAGASVPPHPSVDHAHPLAMARDVLGEETFAAAWAEGCAMSLDQAVRFALEEIGAA
jgi:tetratricopeptide (TPR) repeat protein